MVQYFGKNGQLIVDSRAFYRTNTHPIMFRYILLFCVIYTSAFASPKLIGAWQLESNSEVRLYIEKNNQAFLISNEELSYGIWEWDEAKAQIHFRWQSHEETWSVTEIKNQEWVAQTNDQRFVWRKAEGLKARDAKVFRRRMLGIWTTTDSLYQEEWTFIFRRKNCTEKNANGTERQLQWALSDDARFLQTTDDTDFNVLEIVELKDFSMTLRLNGGTLRFQRELFLTPKSLQVYLTEQRLIGEWLMPNPTEEVKEFRMVFQRDGSVHSYVDGEEMCENWKLSKRGKRLSIYNTEEETRYDLELKFGKKSNSIELKEPGSVLILTKVGH